MNLKHLNNLLRPKAIPTQQKSEWRMFLEICEAYLNKHNITHPIVVELGVGRNRQKKMWETIFGAEHIGMDKSNRRGEPDILGDVHDEAKNWEEFKKTEDYKFELKHGRQFPEDFDI